jgi:hypothetical protein
VSGSARVRCTTCHREEQWQGDRVEVRVPGGSRRPAVAPERARFEALAASLRDEQGPLVGTCSVCEQPLVLLEGERPVIDLTVPLPDGDVVYEGGRLTCGGQPIDLDEAERRVWAAFPATDQWTRQDMVAQGFLTATLPLLAFPVVLWCVAVTVVVVFYRHWATGGGSVGMP